MCARWVLFSCFTVFSQLLLRKFIVFEGFVVSLVVSGIKLFLSHFNSREIVKEHWRLKEDSFALFHSIKLNTHIVLYSVAMKKKPVFASDLGLWGFLCAPCYYYYYARSCFSCYYCYSLIHSKRNGLSHTQTLKSHDNIWCKVGDTYFLLYFCHMLLFKREKIVFYG